jgi:hypothetical protein
MGTHRETSGAILIDSSGRFLFQQRDDNPEILYPGKIGLFDDHREGSETFLDCVVREVYEEISYFFSSERFAHSLVMRVSIRAGHLSRRDFCCERHPGRPTGDHRGDPFDHCAGRYCSGVSQIFAVSTVRSGHFLERPTRRAAPFTALTDPKMLPLCHAAA